MRDDITQEQLGRLPKEWIAFHEKENEWDDRCWYFLPKDYWDANGTIPDGGREPKIDGFYTHTEWTWETPMELSEAIEHVKSIGFEVLENPRWWYDRPVDN